MDDTTDLSRPRGWSEDDDAAARALRAALGEHARPVPGRQAPRETLHRLERRAVRYHRRRQAVGLGGAAAAAAVVVAVGGLVLPQLGSLSVGSSASSGSAAGGAAGSADSAQDSRDESTMESDSAAAAAPSAAPPSLYQAAAAVVSAESMLTAADVTAFADVAVQDAAPAVEGGELQLGACVGGDAGSLHPTSMWRVDLMASPRAVSGAEPPGLVERVMRVGSDTEATDALAALQGAAAGCTGPGLEGTGPTTALDATAVTPDGGQALVLASTTGQGSPTLQVLVAYGTTLVQVQLTSNAGSADAALAAAVETVRTAAVRGTGVRVTFTGAQGTG